MATRKMRPAMKVLFMLLTLWAGLYLLFEIWLSVIVEDKRLNRSTFLVEEMELDGGLAGHVTAEHASYRERSLQYAAQPCYRFPELDLYFSVEQLSGCEANLFPGATLQRALRACLANPSCISLVWDSADRTARQCGFQHSVQLFQGSCQELSRGRVVRVIKRSEAPSSLMERTHRVCPGLLHLVQGPEKGHCSLCPSGFCRTLPSAQLRLAYDDVDVQQRIKQLLPSNNPDHALRGRAYNPSLAFHQGTHYIVYRSGTLSYCPADPYYNTWAKTNINHHSTEAVGRAPTVWGPCGSPQSGCMGRFSTFLDTPLHDSQSPNPTALQPLWAVTAVQMVVCPLTDTFLPLLSSCKHVPWDPSCVHIPRPFKHEATNTGLQDGRLFSWRGRLHLLGYIIEDTAVSEAQRAEGKGFTARMVLAQFRADGGSVETSTLLDCPDTSGHQKNWIPFVLEDQLYLVVNLAPLHVARVEVDAQGRINCIQHQREMDEDGVAALQAGLPATQWLRGSTPFVQLPDGRLLGLAHHRNKDIFVHHLITMSVNSEAALPRFSLDWVSEAFRLPEPAGYTFYIQFASGLLLNNGTLLVAYGLSDCYTALAEVPDFVGKLRHWEQYGLGTQTVR